MASFGEKSRGDMGYLDGVDFLAITYFERLVRHSQAVQLGRLAGVGQRSPLTAGPHSGAKPGGRAAAAG